MRRDDLPNPHSAPPVVVITGGSSGIGRCTAALFARRGWSVGLIARGAAGLAAAQADVAAAGAHAATAQADVADAAALAAAADRIAAALGPIDLWVNCAGNGIYGRFTEVPDDAFRRVTDVTYHGTVNGMRVALAAMRPRGDGAIVNVCSAIAFHGLPLMSSYAGAKAAVRGFTQAVRGELALERSRIRVATIFPPAVNTPFFSHAPSLLPWPARPAPPVYQPEVIAEAIWHAAHGPGGETAVSFTVVGFRWASRHLPGLVGWCMGRLGIDGQMTRDPAAAALLEPTLLHPSRRALGVHGPFGRRARRWSSQLWLAQLLRRRALRSARPDAPSPATPRAEPRHPVPADSAPPPGTI